MPCAIDESYTLVTPKLWTDNLGEKIKAAIVEKLAKRPYVLKNWKNNISYEFSKAYEVFLKIMSNNTVTKRWLKRLHWQICLMLLSEESTNDSEIYDKINWVKNSLEEFIKTIKKSEEFNTANLIWDFDTVILLTCEKNNF